LLLAREHIVTKKFDFPILNDIGDFPVVHSNLPHEEMEDKCRRCGVSCHVSIDLDKISVVIEGLHCKYLVQEDTGKWACSTYETRIEDVPWCNDLKHGLAMGTMAMDCLYVAGTTDYNGKTRLNVQDYVAAWPELLTEIRSRAWEDWWNLDEFAEQLNAMHPDYTWEFVEAEQFPGHYWLEHTPKVTSL